MRNELILEEKILAIQEHLSGFIAEQILDPNGEFYCDGESYIDNRSKYDSVCVCVYIYVYVIKNEYADVNIYVCISKYIYL